MKTKLLLTRGVFFSAFILSAFLCATASLVEAQPSPADTIRFLEQSTFGPTSELVRHVHHVAWEAFLNAQLAAPTTDSPDLPFCPHPRPTSCTAYCHRDNSTL